MFKNEQHKVAGIKRPLSPAPSDSSPKRVRTEYSLENSRFVKEHNEVGLQENDGWGFKTWRNNEISHQFNTDGFSQGFSHASEDEDVKYDPTYLNAQYENQQSPEATKNNAHTTEEDTHPLRLEQSSPCPGSWSWSPESPTLHASSSPCRGRRFRPPPRLCSRRKPPRTPPAAALQKALLTSSPRATPPPAPQTKLLSSPPGATPPPLFFTSPQPSQLGNVEEPVHKQDRRNILVIGENELTYLNNIVPSPSDDVFNTGPSRRYSLSRIIKKKCDDEPTLMPVENPARGPISKWTVVARKEHEELIGYPCTDFKFRTDKHDVLGSWDEMGNIRDVDGNVIR